MKLRLLGVTAVAAAFAASTVLAQSAPPVTMQPIPNPADKAAAKKSTHKSAKHHKSAKKAEAPAAGADTAAPASK